MWFKRKPRNRRLSREHVLDVKVRSSQLRAARARMAAVALGVVFATVIGVFVLWRATEFALDRLIYSNKAFAIQEIEIQTEGTIPPSQIRQWTGVRTGQNLLALDLARVKRDLEMVSMIQSVSIERILPHRLRVRVTEREPLAQFNVTRPHARNGLEMAVYFLDIDGWVIQPLALGKTTPAAGHETESLPLIVGLGVNDAQPGRRIESPQVRAALRLIAAFEQSPMVGLADLNRIDVSSPDVIVVTANQNAQITFSLADPDQQLRRWREVVDRGQRIGKAIASLDLAVSNNIPAVWLDASAAPAANPKPAKPSRKKHV